MSVISKLQDQLEFLNTELWQTWLLGEHEILKHKEELRSTLEGAVAGIIELEKFNEINKEWLREKSSRIKELEKIASKTEKLEDALKGEITILDLTNSKELQKIRQNSIKLIEEICQHDWVEGFNDESQICLECSGTRLTPPEDK